MRLCIWFLVLLTACAATRSASPPIHLLFVGNSLTYTNNLPELVRVVATRRGSVLEVAMLAKPNYALEDHWAEGRLQEWIATERFTHVIVQQGPSSQEDGRQMLLEYGARIQSLCVKHHATLAFFMVWPSRVNAQTFPGIINHYREAATATGALLCPVGEVWKAYMDSTQDYSYYGPDGFHPSRKGSEEAARVLVESLGL